MSEQPSNGTDENGIPETPAAPTWFIEDGRPGDGERPAWLPDKFKSMADLSKSYSELEKRVGSVPESYDLSKSQFLDPNYVPFQEFLATAKEKRVPQEVIDKMVDSLDKYANEFTIDPVEEAQKLGENAKERLTLLDNWVKANLPEDAANALTSSIKSADSIKALEQLRNKLMSNNTMVPNGNNDQADAKQSVEEIRDELMSPEVMGKYKTDPKFRADWQARLAVAAKSSGYIDKAGG